MGLLALAIRSGIAICLFIYFKDKYNQEPLVLLILSFCMGILLFVGSTRMHFVDVVVSFIVAAKLSLNLMSRKQEMSNTHFVNIDTINK